LALEEQHHVNHGGVVGHVDLARLARGRHAVLGDHRAPGPQEAVGHHSDCKPLHPHPWRTRRREGGREGGGGDEGQTADKERGLPYLAAPDNGSATMNRTAKSSMPVNTISSRRGNKMLKRRGGEKRYGDGFDNDDNDDDDQQVAEEHAQNIEWNQVERRVPVSPRFGLEALREAVLRDGLHAATMNTRVIELAGSTSKAPLIKPSFASCVTSIPLRMNGARSKKPKVVVRL
jgi:hypothetical protein